MIFFILPLLFYSTAVFFINGIHLKAPAAAVCGFPSLLWPKQQEIDLEGCSVKEEAMKILERQGITDSLRHHGQAKLVASTVSQKMDELYRANNFFGSSVVSYEISDDGRRLKLKCVEKGVPKANFKFFIRDEENGKTIDVSSMDLIRSSSTYMPQGKFREASNQALMNVLFGNQDVLVQFHEEVFSSIQRSEVWSNLEYAIWHSKDGHYHLHVFADGSGVTRRIDYTLTNLFSKDGARLRVGVWNSDLLGTKLLAEMSTDLALKEWYKMSPNHKVNISVTFNSLRNAIWKENAGNTVVMKVAASSSAHDFLRIAGVRKPVEGEKAPNALMSTSLFMNAWPSKCKIQVAADSETLQFKSEKQTIDVTARNVPVSTNAKVVIKAPLDVINKREPGWQKKVYLNCNYNVATKIRDNDTSISLKLGTNKLHSGFRGEKQKDGGMYIMLTTDVIRTLTQNRPLSHIKPGVYLDLLCTIDKDGEEVTNHAFEYSAGVMVKVLGISISLALSELPKHVTGNLENLVYGIKKNLYLLTN